MALLVCQEEQKRLAGDSEGRCEVLTKGMIKCRKQLGLMRLRDTSPDRELNDGNIYNSFSRNNSTMPLYSLYILNERNLHASHWLLMQIMVSKNLKA